MRVILIVLIFMQVVGALKAQEGEVHSIQWKMGGMIPANPGQQKALGLAGAIIGRTNGFLMVAGGCNFPDRMPWLGGKKTYYDDVFVFEKCGDSFKLQGKAKLPFNLAYAASCGTVEGLFFAGGENENGISKQSYLLQWDQANQKQIFKALPDLPLPLTNASAVAVGNKIYIGGGETIDAVSDRFLILDLEKISQGWTYLAHLPVALSHAVMVSQHDGTRDCIYVLGGRKKRTDSTSQFYSTNFKYNLHGNDWSEKKSLPYQLAAGTGVAFGSHSIVLFGGDQGKTFNRIEELIIAHAKESNQQRKDELNAEKVKLQSMHPGFSKQVLLYNTISDSWNKLNAVPFDVPVTTTALQWENAVVIPGGEIRAGVRSANILMGELKLSKKINAAR
jgi:N-acetylneuraminic acid mutarotase